MILEEYYLMKMNKMFEGEFKDYKPWNKNDKCLNTKRDINKLFIYPICAMLFR